MIFSSTARTSGIARLLSHGWFTGCGSLVVIGGSSFRILALNFLLSRRVVWIPECVIVGTLSWKGGRGERKKEREERRRKALMGEGRWKRPASPPRKESRRQSREWEKKSPSRAYAGTEACRPGEKKRNRTSPRVPLFRGNRKWHGA